MPRRPKPFLYRGWYCTNAGGVPQQKLCREEEGLRQAELALARLLVQRADAQQEAKLAVPGPGVRAGGPQPSDAYAPGLAGPQARMVADVFNEFLDMKKVENDELTYIHYRDKLTPFYERFGGRPIRSLTLQDGLAYKEWLRKDKTWKKGKRVMRGVGPATVNHHIRAAKTLLNWAAKASRRYIDLNPWEEIGYLTEKPRERLITEEEFCHLLEQCTDGSVSGGARDFREQLIVLRHTTMRPGELLKLRWDYQWERHKIVFPADVIKTKNRRPVTMLPVVEQTLQARMRRLVESGLRADGFVFSSPGKGGDGKQTATTKSDSTVQGNSFSQRFRRLFLRCVGLGLIEKEKAGERLVLYSSRHTRITELVASGLPMKVIMDEAGHKIPNTTNRYTHLADDFITEAVRRAGGPDAGAG
jgi:integrase